MHRKSEKLYFKNRVIVLKLEVPLIENTLAANDGWIASNLKPLRFRAYS